MWGTIFWGANSSSCTGYLQWGVITTCTAHHTHQLSLCSVIAVTRAEMSASGVCCGERLSNGAAYAGMPCRQTGKTHVAHTEQTLLSCESCAAAGEGHRQAALAHPVYPDHHLVPDLQLHADLLPGIHMYINEPARRCADGARLLCDMA